MKEVAHSQPTPTPFVGVSARSIEDMEAEASRLLEQAKQKRIADERESQARYEQKKSEDMAELLQCRKELASLDSAAKLAGQLSLADARKLSQQRTDLTNRIQEIESAYQIGPTGYEEVLLEKAERKSQAANIRATVFKVGSLIALCFIFVLFSGDWILGKYPGAAIYNEVSFQKVLFSLPVHLCSVAAVILCLNALFPGFGTYFNPFNTNELDFYDDFSTLSEWQRNIISLVLFSVLLFSFVWIVSGKLD